MSVTARETDACPDRSQVRRLAGRLPAWPEARWCLEPRRIPALNARFPLLAGRHGSQEPHAGETISSSIMYHRDLRCFDCHDIHGNQNPSNLAMRSNELCLNCHTKKNPSGLRGIGLFMSSPPVEPRAFHNSESGSSRRCECPMV